MAASFDDSFDEFPQGANRYSYEILMKSLELKKISERVKLLKVLDPKVLAMAVLVQDSLNQKESGSMEVKLKKDEGNVEILMNPGKPCNEENTVSYDTVKNLPSSGDVQKVPSNSQDDAIIREVNHIIASVSEIENNPKPDFNDNQSSCVITPKMRSNHVIVSDGEEETDEETQQTARSDANKNCQKRLFGTQNHNANTSEVSTPSPVKKAKAISNKTTKKTPIFRYNPYSFNDDSLNMSFDEFAESQMSLWTPSRADLEEEKRTKRNNKRWSNKKNKWNCYEREE